MDNKVMPHQNIKWPGSIDIGKFYFEYLLKGPSNKTN